MSFDLLTFAPPDDYYFPLLGYQVKNSVSRCVSLGRTKGGGELIAYADGDNPFVSSDTATIQSILDAHDPNDRFEWKIVVRDHKIVLVGQTAYVDIYGVPGVALIEINGMQSDVTIEGIGSVAVPFVPVSPGEYVIRGVSGGQLENSIEVIRAI